MEAIRRGIAALGNPHNEQVDPKTISQLETLRKLYFRDDDDCGINWGPGIPSTACRNKRPRDDNGADVFAVPPKGHLCGICQENKVSGIRGILR
jgi:hypothetical protein